MSSKIKVDTIENVAGSGNVSLGSGHNLVVPGSVSVNTIKHTGGTTGLTVASTGIVTASKEVIQTDYMIDQWRLSANFGTNDSVINAGWERPDDPSYGRIGTGMTESSGIFTFPSTGVYHITVQARIQIQASDGTAGFEMKVSTDGGSSSDTVATAYESNNASGNTNSSASASILVNVTNTSNFQFFVKTASIEGSNSEIRAHTNENQTMITFERKGPSQ